MTKYPPFAKIIRILLTAEDDNIVKDTTHKLILALKDFRVDFGKDFYFLEAMKSPINKIKNKHRYQIVMRYSCAINDTVLDKIHKLLTDNKTSKVSVFVETNPISLS